MEKTSFANVLGFPDELVPILIDNWSCEYASLKNDGTPVTIPLIPWPGEDGCTIDVNTGLTYPTKAERARNNPQVCLLYSEPRGAAIDKPPVVLVYGQATVYDANLQANTDRVVRGYFDRMSALSIIPRFMLRWMGGYLARIWIAITPLKIIWWPEGNMDSVPKEWRAPSETEVPPCDPKPAPLAMPHKPLVTPNSNWKLERGYQLCP
jgi:hypothetical protein